MILRIIWKRDVSEKEINYWNDDPVYKRGDGVREKKRYYRYEAG